MNIKKEEHENEIKEFIFPRDYAIWVDSKGHVCYIVLFVFCSFGSFLFLCLQFYIFWKENYFVVVVECCENQILLFFIFEFNFTFILLKTLFSENSVFEDFNLGLFTCSFWKCLKFVEVFSWSIFWKSIWNIIHDDFWWNYDQWIIFGVDTCSCVQTLFYYICNIMQYKSSDISLYCWQLPWDPSVSQSWCGNVFFCLFVVCSLY